MVPTIVFILNYLRTANVQRNSTTTVWMEGRKIVRTHRISDISTDKFNTAIPPFLRISLGELI